MHFAKVFGSIGMAVMVIIASANGGLASATTKPSSNQPFPTTPKPWNSTENTTQNWNSVANSTSHWHPAKNESEVGSDGTTVVPDRNETSLENQTIRIQYSKPL